MNFIGYLQVSKSCRSLVYGSIDPCLWGNTKHGNYVPVTLTMHGHLIGSKCHYKLQGGALGLHFCNECYISCVTSSCDGTTSSSKGTKMNCGLKQL